MAPRAPETLAGLTSRLRAAAKTLAQRPVRFGSPHHTHAVVAEAGVFRVRELFLPMEKVEAYRREHSTFMPEHAEMLKEPTGEVVLEAATLEALLQLLARAKLQL